MRRLSIGIAVVFLALFSLYCSAEGSSIKDFRPCQYFPPNTVLIISSSAPRLHTDEDLDRAIINNKCNTLDRTSLSLLSAFPRVYMSIFELDFCKETVSRQFVGFTCKSKNDRKVFPSCLLILFEKNISARFKKDTDKIKHSDIKYQNLSIFRCSRGSSEAYFCLVKGRLLLLSEDLDLLKSVLKKYKNKSEDTELPLLKLGLSKVDPDSDFYAVRHYDDGLKSLWNSKVPEDSMVTDLALELRNQKSLKLFYFSKNKSAPAHISNWFAENENGKNKYKQVNKTCYLFNFEKSAIKPESSIWPPVYKLLLQP